MREAGINDVLIAVIVTEIRSAAVAEEFRRLQYLASRNPPEHFPFGEMREAINR